jgi:hypothetical protein
MIEVDVLDAARAEFRIARRWYRDQSEGATRRFALEVKTAIAAFVGIQTRFHAGTRPTVTIF